MEQTDELVPNPDSKGFLDLTNRAWVNLDPAIWGMAMTLVVLDVSFNHITEIPAQIGELVLLRELRASFNKIGTVPTEIGKLKRLRRLVLNSNRIRKLPKEIGRLDMLEDLIVSENALEELPHTIAAMSTLRILKLENNKLQALPYELADVVTLEEVTCANNPDLAMLPPMWRGNSESILFVCRIHRDYRARMDEMLKTNSDLSKHAQYLEQEQLLLKETMGHLRDQIDVYRRNIPVKKLAKVDMGMRNDGVGGMSNDPNAPGAGSPSGGDGKDNSESGKKASNPLEDLMSSCVVM